jgi:hypothetical protein
METLFLSSSTRFFLLLYPFLPKIPIELELKPHLRTGLKERCKSQCRSGRNTSLTSANFIDDGLCSPNFACKFALAQSTWDKKFLFQNLPRMNGISDGRHDSLHKVSFESLLSVIVTNFNIKKVTFAVSKNNSPPVSDANRVKPFSVALKDLKPVSGWRSQFLDVFHRIHYRKLSLSCSMKIAWQNLSRSRGALSVQEIFRSSVDKCLYHRSPLGIPTISNTSIQQGFFI